MLGQTVQPVAAVKKDGTIAWYSGGVTTGDLLLTWDDGDDALHIDGPTEGKIGINVGSVPSNTVEIFSDFTDHGITIEGSGNNPGFSDLGLRINNQTTNGRGWYLDSTGDDGSGHASL